MFSEKKSNQTQQQPQRNVIGPTTNITGDITSKGDFRVDGRVEGTIKTSGRLIIGKDGFVIGKVDCANADVEGHISGKLTCTGTLTLKASAIIDGEVYLDKLSVEPGATFNATCSMKGVKALKSDDNQPERKKSVS